MAQKNINIGSGALVGDGESIRSAFDKINQNFVELYAGEGTAEVNDLTQAVVWANVPDVNITQSSVTQHQAAITITESQISDLQNYLTSYTETNDLTSAVTWANVPDINITESSVTQHQAALIITESQISDLTHYTDGNVDTHLNTSTAIADQILAWNGTDYNWISQEEVDVLGSFSVTAPAAAFGSGGIDYNSTNGQFTYTPPDLSNFLSAETDTLQTVTTRGATTTNEVELNGGVKTNNVQSANGVHSIGFNEANDLTIGSTGGVKIIGAAAAPLELGTETTGTVTIGSGSNNIVFASTIETNNITALPGDTDIYIQGGINSGTPGNPARVNIGTTNTSTIVLGASDSLIYVNGNDDSIISGGTGIFGTITGDLTGSVFSDDSTVMVDAVNNTLHASSVNAVAIQSSFLGNGGQNGPLQLSSGLEGQTGNSIFINPQGSDTFVQMWGETVNLVTGPYNTYDSPYMQFKTEGAFKAHQGAYFDGNLVGDVTGSVFADDSTLLVDGTNGVIPKAVVEDSTNWDTAFGWGDHAAVGYLTSETTTTLGINANILKYTDETGAETDIDLSLYLDDTNLARLTTGTLDSGTGIATFTRDDATTFTVDFSDLLNQAEANDLTASVTWANVPDANITQSSVTQHQAALSITESQISDLQSYLTTETDPVFSAHTTSNIVDGTGFLKNTAGTWSYDNSTYLTSETSHADVLVDGDFATAGFMKTDGAGNYTVDNSTYLTSFTETNDLTSAVTWANVPDANITESSVTQHQAALSITESQISDLQSYLTTETDPVFSASTSAGITDGTGFLKNDGAGNWSYDNSTYLTSETSHADVLVDGDFATAGFMKTDGAGNYTVDNSTYLTSFTETNDLTAAVTWANVPDANITQSSVTQHQAALSITESQISDLGSYLTDLTGSSVGTLSDVDFNSVTLDGANGQDKVLAWDQTAQAFVPVDQTNTNTTTFGLAGNTGTHTFDMVGETLTFLGTTGQINVDASSNFVSLELDQNINSITSIAFEGTTANNFETKIQAVDPTADRTINLPDADGTFALTSTTLAGYGITDAFDGAFGSLSGTPTTLAGYGITDAANTGSDTTFTANVLFDTGVQEKFATLTGSTGITVMDCDNGQVFYLTGAAGDITANFTNLGLTAEYGTNVTVIINQGATPYEVTAVQIGGVAQTINWQGGSAPTGNANGIDSFSFTILNDGGTYVVLGQMVDFT